MAFLYGILKNIINLLIYNKNIIHCNFCLKFIPIKYNKRTPYGCPL